MSLSEKIEIYNPKIIGITSLCIDVNMVIKLCVEAKKSNQNILTIVGGTQTYLNPDAFFHKAVDYVIEYTQFKNIKKLFECIALGEVSIIDGIRSRELEYKSTGVKGRNEYILPDRDSTSKYRKEYSYFGYKP